MELFAGCGGLSSGFRLPGINVKWAIDINKQACETYKKNFKNTDVSFHIPIKKLLSQKYFIILFN